LDKRDGGASRTAAAFPARADFIASSLPPSRAQRRLAAGTALVMLAMLSIIGGGFSTAPVRRIDGFELA